MQFERVSPEINERLQVIWAVGYDVDGATIGFPSRHAPGDLDGLTFETDEEFFAFREAVNDLYNHIRQETPTD